MKTGTLLLLILNLVLAALADAPGWAQAGREIRYLAPQAYRGLPVHVSRYLQRHGYAIPQTCERNPQHNAVRGRFDADAKPDWAILASRGGYSQILVFWGGSATRVTRLARRADTEYLQALGDGEVGYSRSLSVVGQRYVLDHYQAYGGAQPPAIRHDAIDDGFSGKGSVVYFFDGRRWHQLQGAD